MVKSLIILSEAGLDEKQEQLRRDVPHRRQVAGKPEKHLRPLFNVINVFCRNSDSQKSDMNLRDLHKTDYHCIMIFIAYSIGFMACFTNFTFNIDFLLLLITDFKKMSEFQH